MPKLPTGGEIEQRVSQVGDAAAQIISLGEVGRRRDKERAENARDAAAAELQAAENIRQEKIQQQQIRLASQKEIINLLDVNLRSFQALKVVLQNNLTTTNRLIQALMNRDADFSAYRDLIDSQQKDLTAWFEEFNKGDDNAILVQGISLTNVKANLKSKISAHLEQISKFPLAPNSETSEQVSTAALQYGFEALALLNSNIETMKIEISNKKAEIASLQTELDNLKK